MVAASWVPPGHCDPTVTVSGGVRIRSSWEDFRRVHRVVKKARYIFNIDCEKENTKSKNNKCNLVFMYVQCFSETHIQVTVSDIKFYQDSGHVM